LVSLNSWLENDKEEEEEELPFDVMVVAGGSEEEEGGLQHRVTTLDRIAWSSREAKVD
jgi:hypothetical protein